MTQSTLPSSIVVFTDPGEEIDDELALYRLDEVISGLQTDGSDLQQANVVVVGGKVDATQRIERCRDILKDQKYLKFWTPETFLPELLDGACVLIIGPLQLGNEAQRILSASYKPKIVMLAGSKGNSVNWGSSKETQDNCAKLLESATTPLILEASEISKQKMTPDVLNMFPKHLHKYVALLTWRFLLGRAKAPAQYVAHLASPSLASTKARPASNYVAVEKVYEHKYSKKVADITGNADAMKLAEDYANSLADFDMSCYRVNVDRTVVVTEYANLISALMELGWYTDKVLYSDDETLSDQYLLNNTIPEFEEFCETIFSEIGSPLPCYDLTALNKFLDVLKIPYH